LSGILRVLKLSVVFYESLDLQVPQNQFSLLIMNWRGRTSKKTFPYRDWQIKVALLVIPHLQKFGLPNFVIDL